MSKPQPWAGSEELTLSRYAKTHTAAQIGAMLGRTKIAISSRARLLKIRLRKYGEYHHETRYPDEIVREALRLREEGLGPTAIGKHLGVPRQAVTRWTNGYDRYVVAP